MKKLSEKQMIKALDKVYDMSESSKLPVKEWDAASVLNRVKQELGIELSIEGNDLSSYRTEKLKEYEKELGL